MFVGVLVLAVAQIFAAEDWGGVALTGVTFVLAGLGPAYASRRSGWSVRHIAAACAAPLVVRAVWAFTYPPLLGEVSDAAKCAHNTVLLVVVLALTVVALRSRSSRGVRPVRSTDDAFTS